MNFQTHFSRMMLPYEERICESNPGGGKSQTVPGLTLSLKELAARYIQRRDVPQGDGVYLPEDSILNGFNVEYMDPEDRLEFSAILDTVITDEYNTRKKSKKPAAPASPTPEIITDDLTGI